VLYSQRVCTVGSAGNYGFKKNAQIQDLLDRALTTYDQAERARLYEEANALLVEQCSHVFVAHADQNLAFLYTVHGYVIHPTSRKFFYPVWIEEGECTIGLSDTEEPPPLKEWIIDVGSTTICLYIVGLVVGYMAALIFAATLKKQK
jgi:hypothetical protein